MLLTVFAEYMKKVKVPCYSSETRGCSKAAGYPLFRLFPVSNSQQLFLVFDVQSIDTAVL